MASNLTPSTVNGQEIFLTTNVCAGDSGAGLFRSAQTSVAGVLSRGNAACTEGAFERLDTLRPWLTGVGVESGDDPSWTGVEPAPDAVAEDAADAAVGDTIEPAAGDHAKGSSCRLSPANGTSDGGWAWGLAWLAGFVAVQRRRDARVSNRA
jgi:MYXO-CTERM domain-containing protein